MELNREQLEVYQKATNLCSKSEKCSNEIRFKLAGWGLNEDDAALVLERLIDEKFVDDERYAKSYVRDKFRFNKWGKVKIAYQLRASRIDSGIIDAALAEIDEDAYWELLVDLISEKNRTLKAANQYDRKAKLMRFAQSKGFEMDLIYPALDEILKT